MNDLIPIVQGISALIIASLVAVLLVTMLYRVYRYIKAERTVPIILRRDLALFAILGLLLFGGIYVRATHDLLSDDLWWVVLTNGLAIFALAYWLGVEWGIIRPKGDK